MKIGGIEVKPCVEILVLPRAEGEDIIIRAKAVAINKMFEKMAPEPVAPQIRTKDGSRPDYKDPDYKKAVAQRESKRFALMVIKSLEDSGIEWEKTDLDKPETWLGWDKELQEAGLSEVETNRIIGAVMVANSLDEAKLIEARAAFLQGQGE
jgi:hypothetical protein